MSFSIQHCLLVAISLSLAFASQIAAQTVLPPVAKLGVQGYVSGELIYELEGRLTPRCHASTIEETPSGLVAAWFGGKHENNPDVGIWVSRHDGKKWSKPVEVVDGSEGEEQEFACWNPVLFQPKNAPLMLFYKVGKNPRLWWGMLITSEDGGKTWSKPRRLGKSESLPDANPNLLGPVKNKPIQLDDGSILCASSTENDGWRVHFELTKDMGKTWEVIGPINDATKFNAIQPTILTFPDRRMQELCRSQENVITQSWSNDGGKSWSPVTATDLPNPSAGVDAVTLRDGRHLLVYNHAIRKEGFNGRQIINVAISNDGEKWTPILTLENEGNEAGYSYPAIIQTKDGKVHITYTWRRQSIKHVVINPSEIN